MSQFVTKLRENKDERGQTGRDGISWPSPAGTWKQNESVNRLETFANNLDVAQAPGDTDLLNSVPTPWARLLLFESALYNEKHPAHQDVEDQWRGLLGVLALAQPLRLNFSVTPVLLGQIASQHQSRIAKSFIDLRPHYQTNAGDVEQGKWDDFQMIVVDGTALGATSPRTLVFTGVTRQCPSSIPFHSVGGRLSDPVAYYRRFNDTFYLGLLAHWLNGFINALQQNVPLDAWMGNIPAAPGANPSSRLSSLLARLRVWQQDLANVVPADLTGANATRFTLYPYTVLTGLPEVAQPAQSDLFVRGRNDLIVCYHSDKGSKLLNSFGQELVNEPLKVYDGRWIQANQPMPLPLNFLPDAVKRIEDPAALFEDSLIQVQLPDNPEAVYSLSVGDKNVSQMHYLYPFKSEILNYFTPADIAANSKILPNTQSNSLRVELDIPVSNNRSVKVFREYPVDGVIARAITAGLASWPDFVCTAWTRYYYLKLITAGAGARTLDFEPLLKGAVARPSGARTWYATREPVRAFVGTVDGKNGLLLLNQNSIDPPARFLKVGVDFGSTHTRAFSLAVERHGEQASGYEYVKSQGSTIEPVEFATRSQMLTAVNPLTLRGLFPALKGSVIDQDMIDELKTLMMMPEPGAGTPDNWLPRDGYVYTHWIYDGDYDPNGLRFNLKWNSHKDDPDLRNFLRCLLVMLQAEAVSRGARVVWIRHTFPSVFTASLKAKHNDEWRDLQSYLNLGAADADSRVTVETATENLTETVAVCRHLEWEQKASPVSNTISLDVGGSTTDIAVWAQKKLEVQESVKLAAGLVGRYLQSPDAQEFLKWFETTMQSPPYNLKNVLLSRFASKPSGYSLMFTNLLSVLAVKGHLKGLVAQINAEPAARHFMAHIIFLFGSLLYFAGLLARRAGLPQHQDTYNIYFCGRGGTLVEWIKGYPVLAQEMFAAGLLGPDGRQSQQDAGKDAPQGKDAARSVEPTVMAQISQKPKQEVGRGLLADSDLEGNPRGEQIGLVDPNPPSVTVGETGYDGLEWNGELSPAALKQLPDNKVPPVEVLNELNAFLEAFMQGRATSAAAVELNLHNVTPAQFRNQLLQRLFGSSKGCIISDIKKSDPDALLESLFITEVKVLLETATQNIEMFP